MTLVGSPSCGVGGPTHGYFPILPGWITMCINDSKGLEILYNWIISTTMLMANRRRGIIIFAYLEMFLDFLQLLPRGFFSLSCIHRTAIF